MHKQPRVSPRFAELAHELLQQTLNGKIHWRRTDDRNSYLLLRDAGHVLVSANVGGGHSLALYAPSGEEIESYTGGLDRAPISDGLLASTVQQLWMAAQASTQGSDGLVWDFLQDLRKG